MVKTLHQKISNRYWIFFAFALLSLPLMSNAETSNRDALKGGVYTDYNVNSGLSGMHFGANFTDWIRGNLGYAFPLVKKIIFFIGDPTVQKGSNSYPINETASPR